MILSSTLLLLIACGLFFSLFLQIIEEYQFLKKLRFIHEFGILFYLTHFLGLVTLGFCIIDQNQGSLVSIFAGFLLLCQRLWLRYQIQFPVCGGSDTMLLLSLTLWTLTQGLLYFWPDSILAMAPILYLGVQGVLSYFVAGLVKIKSSDWRNGKALKLIFEQSHYAVPIEIRFIFKNIKISQKVGLVIVFFELIFPLALLNENLILIFLAIAFMFHIANAVLFKIHRFIWAWICCYPAIYFLSQMLHSHLALN